MPLFLQHWRADPVSASYTYGVLPFLCIGTYQLPLASVCYPLSYLMCNRPYPFLKKNLPLEIFFSFAFLVHPPMDSPPPQLREALPSVELFPAQPSGPETGPAAHSSLPSGHHSCSSHPSFGSRGVLEALAAAMHRLTLSSQVSQAPGMTPVGPSSAASVSFYGASLKGLKYPIYGGSRKSNRSQHLLDGWTAFKSALGRRFVQWNAASTDTQKLPYGLRQIAALSSCPYPTSAAAFNRQHLSSDKIEEANIREDEAEFAVFPAAEPPFFSNNRNRRNSSPQAADGLILFALHVDKLSGTPVPSISAQVIKTNSLISSPKQLVFEGTVNNNPITSLLNGGADHSIMSRAFALSNKITMHPLDPPIATTFANNSSEVIRFATEPLQLQCQGHRSFVQPLVNDGASYDLLVRLDWLQKNNPRVDWDHGSFMLSDSDHCYKWQAVYSDAEFHDDSWASPVFFVSKKNGGVLLVVDYRCLKSQTQPDKFPFPLIEVLIDKMSKSKVFSSLDLRNGFYQIRVADGDVFKTSFSSPVGLLEWTVMPMGLINAQASFQLAMSELFKDLQIEQVYLDDLVVPSTTLSSRHDHLRHVFQPLQENAFHLYLTKCSFDGDCIDFLGFQISPAGVLLLAANVSSILSMPSTFSSRTAQHNPSLLEPALSVKYLLASSPVLSIFDCPLPSRTTCDASSFGIVGLSEQQHPDGWNPTQFLSKTLFKPETNYPVTDKECLAVICALTKWRPYLQQRFCIRTDHKPVFSLLSKSSTQLQDRRARWMNLCTQFSFKIEHMSGKDTVVATSLADFPRKQRRPSQ
ncbi:hypothetical protein Efla_004577 [Eimeria flavescens]